MATRNKITAKGFVSENIAGSDSTFALDGVKQTGVETLAQTSLIAVDYDIDNQAFLVLSGANVTASLPALNEGRVGQKFILLPVSAHVFEVTGTNVINGSGFGRTIPATALYREVSFRAFSGSTGFGWAANSGSLALV